MTSFPRGAPNISQSLQHKFGRASMRIIAALCFSFLSFNALASDEATLFDGRGRAVAYIANDLTIYLWSGKPVAYLDRDSSDGFHVYGFNGKHLGWFTQGIARDHSGNGACAIQEVLSSTESEPSKSSKESRPSKSSKESSPSRPSFSRSWSDTPCRFFLQDGAS